jgi:hypothetical protein
MERTKLNHEVGSIYIPKDRRKRVENSMFAEQNFDETFMQGVIGSFIGSMIIFGTLLAIVLFV